MQTNTWVLVSGVNGTPANMGTTGDKAIVISLNYVPNSDHTCNGVNCGFDMNYFNKLKANGQSSNTNWFDTSYWQLALDQMNIGYNRLHAVALNDGDNAVYEYAIVSKAEASGSAGNMEDAGWSAVHLERQSVGGAFTTGTVVENFNDRSVNTGTVNQFCGGATNTLDTLHNNAYGQGTTDVGFYFIWTCNNSSSYGGDGERAFYVNFFTPNPTTNTLDLVNTEGLKMTETDDSVFGGGLSGNNMYFQRWSSLFKGDTIVLGGANYFEDTSGNYLFCNSTNYCGGAMTFEWNSTKTDVSTKSFETYMKDNKANSYPIYNSDDDIVTFYFTNITTNYSLGYVTPTIDKNRGSWIGFLNTSATDGDTVNINIISGKATGLTGLTAGTNYYVGGDGSLTTSGSSSNKFCVAISQTECLILNSNF